MFLALCSTAQQQIKHQCTINTVILLKPNTASYQTLWRKNQLYPSGTQERYPLNLQKDAMWAIPKDRLAHLSSRKWAERTFLLKQTRFLSSPLASCLSLYLSFISFNSSSASINDKTSSVHSISELQLYKGATVWETTAVASREQHLEGKAAVIRKSVIARIKLSEGVLLVSSKDQLHCVLHGTREVLLDL